MFLIKKMKNQLGFSYYFLLNILLYQSVEIEDNGGIIAIIAIVNHKLIGVKTALISDPFTDLLIVNNGVAINVAKTPIFTKNDIQDVALPIFCEANKVIIVVDITPKIPINAP
jgi:hypothetical protein